MSSDELAANPGITAARRARFGDGVVRLEQADFAQAHPQVLLDEAGQTTGPTTQQHKGYKHPEPREDRQLGQQQPYRKPLGPALIGAPQQRLPHA